MNETPAKTAEGQVVWITGASSGIGRALAHGWGARGAKLILSGRDLQRLSAVADRTGAETITVPFDVRDSEAMQRSVERALAWAGRIDVLVNNAGISQRSLALETSMEVYRQIIDIDLVSQIELTQAILPKMVSQGGGKLVFISSIAGKVGVPLRTAYSAAKFGLIGYADALRAEVKQHGIDVHVIAPGSVATDVSKNALGADAKPRGFSDEAIDNGMPVGKAAREIVDAVTAGEREVIVSDGAERRMGELRKTQDEVFDRMAALMEEGYAEKLGASGGK
ncbi:MAG: SDR family NAD(P)-dependent oxidoreductase [Sphingomonadaceae bacterium]|jgi:dehydrogenase/reductase SDR family member 7B